MCGEVVDINRRVRLGVYLEVRVNAGLESADYFERFVYLLILLM